MARRTQSLKLLFVADPLAHFDYQRETSLFIMHEAASRGHRLFYTQPKDLSSRGTKVWAACRELKIKGLKRPDWYRALKPGKQDLAFFDAVLLRKDPPFDLDYLHHLYLLNIAAPHVYMMNHPQGILLANEKLWPLTTRLKIPDTLVSAEREELAAFAKKHPGGVILKPIGSSGGRGVFLLRGPKDSNWSVILETATQGFTRHVIAQEYLKEVEQGDKRILLLNGEILGAFTRIPARGQHRANLHAGGTLRPTRLKPSDLACVTQLKPHLRRLGLDFVGIDLIGAYLTEINVTSPMGLNEINQTGGKKSQGALVDFLEMRVKNR